MNVVLDSSNLKRRHSMLARDAADVGPYPLLDFLGNQPLAVLRAENDMIVERSVCVGHLTSN
jgi:hypothetical protein